MIRIFLGSNNMLCFINLNSSKCANSFLSKLYNFFIVLFIFILTFMRVMKIESDFLLLE